MIKKALLGAGVLIVVLVGGLYVWANAILATESVRAAIAAQLANAIGQPVTIGGIGAGIFPRIAVNLEQVAIGEPPRIRAETLHIETNLGALLSRRIEHGELHVSGARIELPLPALGGGTAESADQPVARGAPVEIVSIDEITLSDVAIVSGGRTLAGDIEAQFDGGGLVIRRLELTADDTNITASGRITDLSGPAGELSLEAGALNVDQILAFAGDFAAGFAPGSARTPSRRAAGARPATAMNVRVALDADRATMGTLAVEKLTGEARITPEAVTIDPVAFGLFGGQYQGSLTADVAGKVPSFRWNAALRGVDVAAATAFAGRPNTVSGRLSGNVDISGSGADASTAIRSARGSARIDIADGVVRNLGLLRAVVIATSMREGAFQKASSGGSTDEPFTRLGATLKIGGGAASTNDLRFESRDLLLTGGGTVQLDGSSIDVRGRVQLSDELSKQAGSDLLRYTAEQGRVTLPATITGSATNPSVTIDVADMARRAITNRLNEEVQKQLKGLGGVIRRR